MAWLTKTLADPNQRVFIAHQGEVPVGSLRAELTDRAWKLSWIVAPEQRGRGIGKAILKEAARFLSGPTRAEVKRDNIASAACGDASRSRE
jgi:ribosomal protein S18 acetylase RimI-like enzyme